MSFFRNLFDSNLPENHDQYGDQPNYQYQDQHYYHYGGQDQYMHNLDWLESQFRDQHYGQYNLQYSGYDSNEYRLLTPVSSRIRMWITMDIGMSQGTHLENSNKWVFTSFACALLV